MSMPINIDKATECVKNIIDTNRCEICDKSSGNRMRYPCGHTSCEDCVPATDSCPFCLTSLDSSTFAKPFIDNPYTQRSKNANRLLSAFQTEFGVDVYKRTRILEKLKVEKELFPQCIQAPAKYYNKRKSSKSVTENKENRHSRTTFPGEEVSSLHKMENSNANVIKWLDKSVKRKPLADVNHTRTILNPLQKQPQKVLNTQNILINRAHRKRNYSEIRADENKSYIDDHHITPIKKHKERKIFGNNKIGSSKHQKNNKDDSGIVDDDRIIVLDDSQSIRVDKDFNAWLAVLEAENNVQCESTTLDSRKSNVSKTTSQPDVKIPFYKKSSLYENCDLCNDNKAMNNDKKSVDQPNVSITVESKSFTAIINVSKSQHTNKIIAMQSVEVQTDLKIKDFGDENQDKLLVERADKDIIEDASLIPSSSKIEDIFLGEANNFSPVKSVNRSSNVIIAESDSDEDVEHSTSLQVTAEIHRSYDEILVLGDVEDLREHSKLPRRAARGHTPTSTDSSDKENYNPNRKRRSANFKKKSTKK